MRKTRTIKEIDETSDIDFAIKILKERKLSLTNAYSPLSYKLGKAIETLEKFDGYKKGSTFLELTKDLDPYKNADRIKESLDNEWHSAEVIQQPDVDDDGNEIGEAIYGRLLIHK